MELFYSKLDKHIESLDEKFRSKFVITRAVYNDIILVIKDGWGEAQFKFWVHKHFKLVTIGELQVVYGIKSNNPVITYEQLYIKIKECHERVKQQYCWIPFDVVVIFISQCDVCCNRKGFPKPIAGLAPVVYAINTSDAKSINKTPYEVVFGQKPRSDFEVWKLLSEAGIEDEEKLPQEFVNALNEVDCGGSDIIGQSTQCAKEVAIAVQSTHYSKQLINKTMSPKTTNTVEQSPLSSSLNTICHKGNDTESNEDVKCCNAIDHEEVICSSTLASIDNMNNNNDGDDISTPDRHKRIRDEAEEAYMKTIAKRQRLYDDAQHLRQFQIGDLVGLKIDKVDRTNTTPKILPCKVISIQSSYDNINIYCLCTTKCVLSSKYYVNDLIDLTKCNFAELRAIDFQTLPTQTFIQACKDYVSSGFNPVVEACVCHGACATKKCQCKAAKVPCGTKCHPAKKKSCTNI
ncbi:unnamed protein product [Rotaria sp. Silwood1]|nr:unnamed protein product [Rotaria sp. Silwood1]CAF1672262.1 unnamed protein product [Rotaria sp. Silwood1]CAF3940301.1 unnamed protein product [Rotaria sp. Silwood1]CAF5012799.1 unnamed protein product [Rotaria sp. Silwood1]CAF5035506.1 unnamed protein product [Rotaria sp. Silwood1]